MDREVRRRFLDDYSSIRHAEGRGSDDPEYFRALPYGDLTGRNSQQWSIRARTWAHFERTILAAIERETDRPLDILDVGAGKDGIGNTAACGIGEKQFALRKFRRVIHQHFLQKGEQLRGFAGGLLLRMAAQVGHRFVGRRDPGLWHR